MQQAPKTLSIHGRTFELRKDATDPTMTFPYQLVTPLNSGCTQIQPNVHCCWVRGIIAPRAGTIEKPMEVVGLGFSEFAIPANSLLRADVVQSMHFYVANDESFMQDFANAFMGLNASTIQQGGVNMQPVSLSPFPTMGGQQQSPKSGNEKQLRQGAIQDAKTVQ